MRKPTTLLDSYDKKVTTENGLVCESFTLSGDSHKKAIVDAVIDAWPERSIDDETIAGLAFQKARATIVMVGENIAGVKAIVAEEVTLFAGGGRPGILAAYLPKGSKTKGFGLVAARCLDVIVGWDIPEARRRVEAVQSFMPALRPLTPERLAQLPERGEDCTLALFGTWRSPDGDKAPRSIWLLHSYIPEHDIVEGVLIVEPAAGDSEYGSFYGRDLRRWSLGEVVDFPPVSLADALMRTHLRPAEALGWITAVPA